MKKPIISIIVAHDKHRGIGINNQLPWMPIKEDFRWFQSKTIGHPVIMGRRTFQSLPSPLSKRTNIIVTRRKNFKGKNILIAKSLESALKIAEKIDNREIFIIGGAQVYAQGLPVADRLYITQIDADFEVDSYFPAYQKKFNKVIFEKLSSDKNYNYKFLILEK